MVIRTERDFSRRVDEVGVIALPYLVFAEDKFKAKLSQAMAALVHDYLRFDTVTLQSLIDCVMDMIEEYRHSDIAGTDNIQTIDMYASELSTQEDRYKQMNERLDRLDAFIKKNPQQRSPNEVSSPVTEKAEMRKRGRPKKDRETTESINTEASIPELVITAPINTEAPIPEPIIIASPICPSCGMRLHHESLKSGENYYCFKARKGCGKNYVAGKDGILIEKNTIQNPLYICQCGMKLHAQGKEEIDGESYQIYACEPSTKGGCGTGYIQDKEGDLHVGRSKIALSRPKISKG